MSYDQVNLCEMIIYRQRSCSASRRAETVEAPGSVCQAMASLLQMEHLHDHERTLLFYCIIALTLHPLFKSSLKEHPGDCEVFELWLALAVETSIEKYPRHHLLPSVNRMRHIAQRLRRTIVL